MRVFWVRLCLAVLVLGLVAAPRAAAEPGGRPPDYENTDHLSQPVHEETVRESVFIAMRDGVRLFADVYRPAGMGRWGTIVELSPYHGNINKTCAISTNPDMKCDRKGGGTIAGGLVGYFVPRGYAVVVADLRGTGNSDGCLDYLGPNDRSDSYELVEWAARQTWSNGRVGMAGVSYVASTPIMAAGARPPHLRTIVVIAGIAQAYDHQAQGGVPYFAHWAGLAAAYEALATVPPDPAGDDTFLRAAADTGCGVATGAPAMTGRDYISGRYLPWHDAHDWRAAAAAADIPVFVVQGFTDIAVRPLAIEWFARRKRAGDKIWLGQWGHQASNRAEQWTGVLHRWFDRQLQGRRVDTGPPVEMFMSPVEDTVRTGSVWPPPSSRKLTLYPALSGGLSTSPPVLGTATLVARADSHVLNIPATHGGVVFDSAPLTADTAVAGFPEMRLKVTFDAPSRIDLIMTVFAVRDTRVTRLTQGALNPELRESLRRVVAIPPGVPMTLTLPTFATDYVLRKGERLRVVVNSVDGDKLPFFSGPGRVTIHLGGPDPTRVVFPVVDSPSLYPDFREL